VRRTKEAAVDAMEDARHGIKKRPLNRGCRNGLRSICVGMLAGWLVRARRD